MLKTDIKSRKPHLEICSNHKVSRRYVRWLHNSTVNGQAISDGQGGYYPYNKLTDEQKSAFHRARMAQA